ncbi:hypothetical protein [Aeoliella sp.]|uniref:hypothetical protein n=1 Tax=Aeoliella sp. TaxID=2795800 RepID=UPI003CCBB79E
MFLTSASIAWGQSDSYFRDAMSNTPLPAPAGPDGNWNINDNWWDDLDNHFIPDHSVGSGERATIRNGGTAYVDTDGGVYPGAISIGTGSSSGGLEIRNGGTLHSMQGGSTSGNIAIGSADGVGTVDVLPGGTLTAEGAVSIGSNAGNRLVVGGMTGATATLSSATADFNSTVQVYPNASVSTTSLASFGSSGYYQAEITGDDAGGFISVGTTATLGGTLHLNFNYVPSSGHSWKVLDAQVVNGSFDSVTTSVPMASNERVVLSKPDIGGGRVELRAQVEEILVLDVNRNTGAVTIKHPGSSTIEFDGYSVGSDIGLLSDQDANWDSLVESGQYGSDWVETAQTVKNVSELKVGADAAFAGDIELGNIYDALAGVFGGATEDLVFEYRRSSDSAVIPGIVQYSGIKVNNLLLQVDPTGAGDAYLRNTSNTTVQIDSYEVLSDSGSLTTAGWDSLAEQGVTSNIWLEADTNSATQLAEFDSQGFLTLAPGAKYNLGPLFTGGDEDLEFNFLLMGDSTATTGAVIYSTFVPGVSGDFNEDGVVNLADYTVWRNNLGGPSLPNDDGLGTVGSAHYELWKTHFGEVESGSLAAVNTRVPEPTALGLVLVASVGLLCSCRRGGVQTHDLA